jgi:alpha-beta hydrolase superfamily lysophospholipase
MRAAARFVLAFVAAALLAACTAVEIPRGPALHAPHMDGEAFAAADGARLPYRVWPAGSGEPKAVILALHGFNDHSRAWEMPAGSWAARGILTYAYDQRGFGRAPHPGLWPGADALVGDLADALATIRARHPGVPVFVAGESMGGAVTMVADARRRLEGAAGTILVAPAVRGWTALGLFERMTLRLLYRTIPGAAPTVSGTGIVPSDNVAMLRELSRDPLVLKRTRVDALKGLVDLMDEALAAAASLDRPALILLPGRDMLVTEGPTARMLGRLPPAPPADIELRRYADSFHMLLRDLGRERAHADVADWILARVPPR